MSDLYNKILSLCDSHGVSGYKLCKTVGIQPSVLTDLKMGRQAGLSAKNADKIASYFGVSVGFLLGTETENTPTPEGERIISDDDIKFALWGDTSDITEEDLNDVKRFAAFIRERKQKND